MRLRDTFDVQSSLVGREFTSHVTVVCALKCFLQVLPRFGLIDDRADRWTTFIGEIERLNETAERGVQFKVFFLGRHGEGYRGFLILILLIPVLTRRLSRQRWRSKVWWQGGWSRLRFGILVTVF